MRVFRIGFHHVASHLVDFGGIRTASTHPFLRFAHFGGGYHFHSLGDLARVLHALDLGSNFLNSCHFASCVRPVCRFQTICCVADQACTQSAL